jgi:hypothetical protein
MMTAKKRVGSGVVMDGSSPVNWVGGSLIEGIIPVFRPGVFIVVRTASGVAVWSRNRPGCGAKKKGRSRLPELRPECYVAFKAFVRLL